MRGRSEGRLQVATPTDATLSHPDTPTLSVIIPIGPGDESWRDLLPSLLRDLDSEAEVILSAPTAIALPTVPSRDDREVLRVSIGPAGRAAQLNRGAGQARGAFRWLLHADSRLPAGAIARLREAFREDPAALWYFDLRSSDDSPWLMALNQAGTWIRSHWLGVPFGDQGLALPTEAFMALGGFREDVARGEDHLVVWAARRAGRRVRPVGFPLYTSARRYRELGWVATTARHPRLTWAQALSQLWPRLTRR